MPVAPTITRRPRPFVTGPVSLKPASTTKSEAKVTQSVLIPNSKISETTQAAYSDDIGNAPVEFFKHEETNVLSKDTMILSPDLKGKIESDKIGLSVRQPENHLPLGPPASTESKINDKLNFETTSKPRQVKKALAIWDFIY